MISSEIRKRFLEFFEKKGHKIVPSSSLLPTDPSVLFTTAGMQQFKEYYLGKTSPYGKNVASCQKCFRTSDIEEVGDERHLTFFEMLGNFSFGGYFKKEAIVWAKEFLDSIGIKIDYVTVFGGDKEVPRDDESVVVWKELGFSEEKGNLRFCGKEDNFWGPTGQEGPCGPTTEIYADGIEIWNIVFNQYYCRKDKHLEELPMPGVDTGMGLERLAKVSQKAKTVFETDLFAPIIKKVEELSGFIYSDNTALLKTRVFRIVADHTRGAVFLASEGVLPSKTGRGYILRRLIRRAIVFWDIGPQKNKYFFEPLIEQIINIYQDVYPGLYRNKNNILDIIQKEEKDFRKTLDQSLKEFDRVAEWWTKVIQNEENTKELAEKVFYLEQSLGFPKELFVERLTKFYNERIIYSEQFEKYFNENRQKHQEISRKGLDQKFKGGLLDSSEETAKLHTATHILNEALRRIISLDIRQKGSNITKERLRFDFNFERKLVPDEIKKVEDKVNEVIKQDLEVVREEMPLEEALKSGAQAEFGIRYPEMVSVYKIGGFSKEICAGPHAKRTSELGKFRIIKEESSGSGIRRIKAILE